MTRKEKEKEFFAYHMDKFRKAEISNPFFTLKTAFFQKGKYGRQVQLFEGELKRGEDIFDLIISFSAGVGFNENRFKPDHY